MRAPTTTQTRQQPVLVQTRAGDVWSSDLVLLRQLVQSARFAGRGATMRSTTLEPSDAQAARRLERMGLVTVGLTWGSHYAHETLAATPLGRAIALGI